MRTLLGLGQEPSNATSYSQFLRSGVPIWLTPWRAIKSTLVSLAWSLLCPVIEMARSDPARPSGSESRSTKSFSNARRLQWSLGGRANPGIRSAKLAGRAGAHVTADPVEVHRQKKRSSNKKNAKSRRDNAQINDSRRIRETLSSTGFPIA